MAFQPALRLVGGGDHRRSRRTRPTTSFNPPSASSAEGTAPNATSARTTKFQPALRLVGGGDRLGAHPATAHQVSTRPPPRRRRGHPQDPYLPLWRRVSTRPPPRRRRGRTVVGNCILPMAFQPALRLVGGGD